MNNPLKLLKLSMHFSVSRIKDPNDSPEVVKTTVVGLWTKFMARGHQTGSEETCTLLLAVPLTCCVANHFLFRWLSFSHRQMEIMIHLCKSPVRMMMENVIEEKSWNSIPVLPHPILCPPLAGFFGEWYLCCTFVNGILVRDNKTANCTELNAGWLLFFAINKQKMFWKKILHVAVSQPKNKMPVSYSIQREKQYVTT